MDPNSITSNPDQTRKRIIEAASSLFSEFGYTGTTTRAIAELAGVNEVTIFRHFGTKEHLAMEIMNQFGGPALAEELEKELSGNYHQDLLQMGWKIMQVMSERNLAIRMAICEAGHFPEFQQVVVENPRQLRRMLARYFDSQMENGHIHKEHPELLAQAFLGMFFSYLVLEGFLGDTLQPELSLEQITEKFVNLFVQGTSAHQE
jgi:AcrR family transcriptional regulator